MSIDILTQRFIAAEQRDSFVVGAGPGDVPIVANGDSLLCPGTTAVPYFQARDSINILSLGYVLPYGFIPGAGTVPVFNLRYKPFGAAATPMPGIFALNPCTFVNGEMNLGAFVDASGLIVKWQLQCQWSIPLAVSMFNTPAALVGTTQYGYFWAKVEHTLSFVA